MTDSTHWPARAGSLAAAARGGDVLLGPALLVALGLLAAGWTLPLMTVRKLLLFTSELSLLDGCVVLWNDRQYLFLAILVAFTFAFPTAKIGAALWLFYRATPGERMAAALRRLDGLGRWSMLDVFVTALAVVAIQISLVADVSARPGIYVFTGAVALSMLAVWRIERLAHLIAAGRRATPTSAG